MNSQSYQYSELPTPTHTRVLVVDRDDASETIRGSLRIIDLDAENVYNCLSYCWGGPRTEHVGDAWDKPVKSVILDGIEVPIRQNLYNALRALRRLDRVEALWVDALCINQVDNAERTNQVSQMAKIYRGAQ
ncbi:heterokaryon incompatibility protein-domain-containing protein [Cercophora newfieldiana]|uniref:Heterokaryon incompatibility protein-domain-containing protein n=1 Tax=Cercophora newfieldiana TaxID=92897 RepID=A0AA39XX82_9PEZI|nr:heterokaryon incompatibility protein-domain-containing protein [Cercophora newfieldiana]